MATSNRERVGRAFELLAQGLGSFVERGMSAHAPLGADWLEAAPQHRAGPGSRSPPKIRTSCSG